MRPPKRYCAAHLWSAASEMRVLYLLRYYPTLTETFVHNEIRGVMRETPGLEVRIAALGMRDDGVPPEGLPDVPVLRPPRRPLQAPLVWRPSPGERWLARHQRPKDVARLRWLAGQVEGVDHVHVHFAGEAAEWAHALWLDRGLPYSVTTHAVDLFRPRPSLVEVLSAAREVLTVAEHHVANLRGLGIAAVRVVRCGPDLDAVPVLPLPEGAGLRALFVGRNVPKKGLGVLLEAWRAARLPAGARLRLVTDGQEALPPGVERLGAQPPSRVMQELGASNLVVLPCQRAPDGDLDGVPVVLMEALAAGRPVLTTPVSGIPELVDAEVGWLVPPGDAGALARALEEIAGDAVGRAVRGGAGRARLVARGFALEAQVRGVRRAWGVG